MEEPRRPPFAGAVLCEGASRRMGCDKALLDVGGRPLAAADAGLVVAAVGSLEAGRLADADTPADLAHLVGPASGAVGEGPAR